MCERVMKVEVISTNVVPHSKRQRPHYCIRVVFYFTVEPDALDLREEGSEKKQNQLAQSTSTEVPRGVASRIVEDVKLIENVGAMSYAIIDQKLVSKEDFFARHQVCHSACS